MLNGVIVLRARGSAGGADAAWRPRFDFGVEIGPGPHGADPVVREVSCPDLSGACRMAERYEERGYVAELRYWGPSPAV
jgi:hypothetical protein